MLSVRIQAMSIVILPIASRILETNIEMPLYYYTSGITLAFGYGIFDMYIEQSQSQTHIYRPVAEWPMWKRSVFSFNDIWWLKSYCIVFDSDVHKVHNLRRYIYMHSSPILISGYIVRWKCSLSFT